MPSTYKNLDADSRLAFATGNALALKEILIWQHGADLISNEMATRALNQEFFAAQTEGEKNSEDVMMTRAREELEADFDLEGNKSSRQSCLETGMVYDMEDDRALFNNRDWDALSEISYENSEGDSGRMNMKVRNAGA